MLLLAAGALQAQHSYTAADVEDGARLYQVNCSGCHGPEGDLVPGVNFSRGKFLTVKSDEDLTHVIMQGVPGTAMPAANFPEFMAFSLVAYLRSMSAPGQNTLPRGDPAEGKLIFEGKGGCLTCHRVGTHGSRLGPDLTDIGGLRRAVQLERALLDAAKSVSPEYRGVRVATKDGTEYKGRLLNLDTFSVQLLDSQERLRSFLKSDLRELSVITDPGMPTYRNKLSTQELGDVVSYMLTLKGTASTGTDLKGNEAR
ncbi:MAG: c-type cytochrome [Bryobacterales bacterium]|nr:c-type cytochrome [Bryobacterales bacterium]